MNTRYSNAGVVVVLVALLLVVVMLFVAFTVDLGLARAAKEQAQEYARSAALAATEAYHGLRCDEQTNECHRARMNEVVRRVREISDFNRIISGTSDGARIDLEAPDEGGVAIVTPGKWRTDQERCPEGERACFEPFTSLDQQGVPDAFQISGPFYTSAASAFTRGFMKLTGFDLNVHATATLTPRRGCFLVDVSRSTVEETHPTWISDPENPELPLCGQGHEFAFALNESMGPRASHGKPYNYINRFHPSRAENCNMYPIRCSTNEIEQAHCADDYQVFQTLGNDDYSYRLEALHPSLSRYPASPYGERYAIDMHLRTQLIYSPESGLAYQERGPEPLGTIMDGLKSALTTFKERRVTGDKACLIFYDHKLRWTRIVNLTDNFDYLLSLVDFNNTTDPSYFDIFGNQVTGREKAIQHELFPLYQSFTDTYAALMEAFRQFDKEHAEGASTSDFIVLIGDGLTNCYHGSDVGDVRCSHKYSYHKRAMDEINELVTTNLSKRNVPVHVILAGAAVHPHTMIIKHPEEDRCLTDDEYRRTFPEHHNLTGYVKGGDEGGRHDFNSLDRAFRENAFYQANEEWYAVAALTQGIWGPIRPPTRDCLRLTPERCALLDGTRSLNDPTCRPPGQQIEDYMERVFEINPFMLVEGD